MKTLKALIASIPFLYFVSCSAPQTQNKVEATDPAAKTETPANNAGAIFILQKDQSSIQWMGSNKFTPKHHMGTIQFSEGSFTIADNQVTSGNFVADMTTINAPGDEYTNGTEKVGYLIDHLKSADFFDAAEFPASSFAITSVKPKEGDPNYTHDITGNMTIKGITKQITFPAKVELNGNNVKASATFTIDRSQWDVKYGSESFFPNLVKDKLIRNEIELTLNLVAKAS